MKVWINREDVDFDVVESMEPVQEWPLVEENPDHDVVEYPTRMAKFNNVRSVTLFFPGNFGGDEETVLTYLGFKGEFEELKQDPIVTLYELNANPADHPQVTAKEFSQFGRNIQ